MLADAWGGEKLCDSLLVTTLKTHQMRAAMAAGPQLMVMAVLVIAMTDPLCQAEEDNRAGQGDGLLQFPAAVDTAAEEVLLFSDEDGDSAADADAVLAELGFPQPDQPPKPLPRLQNLSASDFERLVRRGEPVRCMHLKVCFLPSPPC